jgi:ribosomal protein S11
MQKKKYRLKKKKTHFFFGRKKNKKIGRIYIRRTFTNVFITLTDLKNQVVTCKTSGSSIYHTSKRRKRIAPAVEKIMVYVKKYLRLYNIQYIHIVLNMRIKSHVYTLLTRLKYYGVVIVSMISKRNIAHNGVKGRKLRRL